MTDEEQLEAEVKGRTDTRSLDHGHWMRVGPNTDAAIWRAWANETGEL